MLQESPVIPHNLAQVLWFALASSLGWAGAEFRSWMARRKREPVELAKISAETRQITISTDVSLIQAATEALSKACRVQDEREHWERKAAALQLQVDQSVTQERMDNLQIRQLKGAIDVLTSILDEQKIDYPRWDYVNRVKP
jgi:hypothetical protein